MEFIVIGLAILQMCAFSLQITIKPVEDIFTTTLLPKDESLETRIGKLEKYMQHKIMNQNRALGNLLQLGRMNAVLVKRLMQNCHPLFERLKTPDKVDIFFPNRRSNANYGDIKEKDIELTHRDKTFEKDEEDDTPIVSIIKFGRNMPKLGRLFVDVISNEFSLPISRVISTTQVNVIP